MQLVEDRERAPAGAHLLHRGLIELAPFDGELQRVDMADVLFLEKKASLATHAAAPVDGGSEHIEDACTHVHETSSLFTMAWIPLLPSTSCVTCRSQARLQNTYASERVHPFSATSQPIISRSACFAASSRSTSSPIVM